MKTIVITLAWSFWVALQIHAASADGWTTAAPREEIRPQFQREETGGKLGHGAFTIRADEREGLHGWWQKTFSVTGGRHYRFSAWRHAENIAVPRRRTGCSRLYPHVAQGRRDAAIAWWRQLAV